MVSQINTPSYLLQLKLILSFGRSETWSVSYLASFMFFNIYKGPKGRQSGHKSCNLRSHLLNVTLEPTLGLFILSISQALSWTKMSKVHPEGLNLAKHPSKTPEPIGRCSPFWGRSSYAQVHFYLHLQRCCGQMVWW